MWGALAKLGGLVLTTFGINYAVESYQNKTAEEAANEKDAKIGKFVILVAALFLGYKLLVRK